MICGFAGQSEKVVRIYYYEDQINEPSRYELTIPLTGILHKKGRKPHGKP
ncbi:hypothetical protein [Mucilaginibacter terrae]|uniref:Uncharacterized protein n=1 Tax=Mucilaginibacter terrae TaxID=1955052 RepID=A0ABU3GNG1_9SPHI|nr:hypothetical protein [Mucilaginibacter terrae]MDT3401311.1 hypothetical protein [Mucilaginibacter terrae]